MFSSGKRILALFCSSFFALPFPAWAYESPLSDSAVRDAYFLGQHHDEIFSDFLQKYGVTLPVPKTGPQIASISFYTPFALTAINSNQQASIYSAQQAQIDHDKQPEVVHVVVEIWFTASYGAYSTVPVGSGSIATNGFRPRSPDFWHDFRVRVAQNGRMIVPSNSSGQPHWICGDDSGCELSGATLTFEYPAAALSQNAATVLVTPPEGDPVSVDFDLASLR
jgi:hypothetical protein